MSKPNYRVIMSFDSDRKVFAARCPELEHCTGEGATRAEALGKVEEEIDAQLANMLSHGTTPPRAVDQETFDGQVSAKVSHTLHRDLSYLARSEGVDLHHLVGELLASALEARRQGRGGRPQQGRPAQEPHDGVGNQRDGGAPRRGGYGGRGYSPALDDRANFIEYVRGLEQGNGQPNRPHGGGGHGGPAGGGDGRRRRRGGHGRHGGGPRHEGQGQRGHEGQGQRHDHQGQRGHQGHAHGNGGHERHEAHGNNGNVRPQHGPGGGEGNGPRHEPSGSSHGSSDQE